MMPHDLVKEPPEKTESATVYTSPWENVPVGKYKLYTPAGMGEHAILDVQVERNQHGELYVRYLTTFAARPRMPHEITSLHVAGVLKPFGEY